MTDQTNDRRDFVKTAALAAAALAAGDAGFPAIAKGASPMILPPLPWADNALEPFISKNTIGFHYGKHHKTYFDNLNGMVAGKPEADMDLVSIVKSSAGKADKTAMFNNSAQVWNHTFYWNSLRPKGDAKVPKEIADKIDASFEGGYEGFKKEFSGAAMGQFGSGWAWLVAEGGKLKVVKTAERRDPAHHGCHASPDARRLGACVLPRLPEPQEGLRRRRGRQPPELGLRGGEPAEGLTARRAPGRSWRKKRGRG